MLKKSLFALIFPFIVSATTLPELFHALKNHSQMKFDDVIIKQAKVSQKIINAKLYPTINLFAKYDYYTIATGMVPLPPNTLFDMVKDKSTGQPFSQNIIREGINFTMPLFVKSIFTMSKKAQKMQHSAKASRDIDLLKNEALIVGANANLSYLVALEKSLNIKKLSLKETKRTIKIKVDNGRTQASALYKIEDGLNQINITKNTIALQKEQLISSIRTLTGITLEEPVEMSEAIPLQISKNIGSLKPLKLKIEANELNIKAENEKLYPSIMAYGNYSFSHANAYNNDKNVHENYGNIGIIINIPLLAMGSYQEIKKAKIESQSDKIALQRLQDELGSKAKMLQNSLPLLENSIQLLKKSIDNKKNLLKIAKANYKNGRLMTEEYLRDEDDVVAAKAKLYKTKAQKWQTLMELAVIYANNIEEMVK